MKLKVIYGPKKERKVFLDDFDISEVVQDFFLRPNKFGTEVELTIEVTQVEIQSYEIPQPEPTRRF